MHIHYFDVVITLIFVSSFRRVIECFPKFVEPILELIADYTGWTVSLIAGGLQPAAGGCLNMLRCVPFSSWTKVCS